MQAKKAGLSERAACKVLGLSRGSFRKPKRVKRERKKRRILEAIRRRFGVNKARYGSPRIHLDLQQEGHQVSQKSVAKLMRETGLSARRKRRFVPTTTDSSHKLAVAPNTLSRKFQVDAANDVWAGDITYLWVGSAWAYLATVIDLHSRRIVGWSIADSLHSSLATDALHMALTSRTPARGILVHHDRGVQYASHEYAKVLHHAGANLSMSRRGNCYDNAVAESFFATFKRELGDEFGSTSELRRLTAEYMEWYNTERRHSHLNGLSPIRFELAQAQRLVA